MIEKREVQSVFWCNSNSQLSECLIIAETSCEKTLDVLIGEAKFCD